MVGQGHSLLFSLPYLGLLLFFFVMLSISLHLRNQKSLNKVYLILFLVLLFFFGLRGFVSTDWIEYIRLFESLSSRWLENRTDNEYVEPGFLLYVYIIKECFDSFNVLVFTSTLIDLILLFIIFRKYSFNICFSIIAFFVWYGISMETSLLRNMKSILLFLISLPYLYNHNKTKYLLVNLVGFAFHQSAILYILMYPLFGCNFSKRTLWVIFVVGNVLTIFKIHYLLPIIGIISSYLPDGAILVKTINYINSDVYGGTYGISIGHIERCLMYILVCYFYNDLVAKRKFNKIFINSYVFYFVAFTFFTELSIITERLTLLFAFSYWLLCPNIFEILATKRIKIYYMTILFLFSFMKVTIATNNITMQYSNIIWSDEDRNSREQEIRNYLDIEHLNRN